MITSERQYQAVLQEALQVEDEIAQLLEGQPSREAAVRLQRLQYHQMELEAALVAWRERHISEPEERPPAPLKSRISSGLGRAGLMIAAALSVAVPLDLIPGW